MQYGGTDYIITNKHHTVYYIGVTSDLYHRIKEHREKTYPRSFSARYNCYKLVWFESYSRIEEAIDIEKKLKGGSRKNKESLINLKNPEWRDLWEDVCEE